MVGSTAGDALASESLNRLAELMKALGHPVRMALARDLTAAPQRVTELQQRLSLAQSTLSEHLKVLRESGIVTPARGHSKAYTADPEVLDWLVRTAADAFARHADGAGAGPALPGFRLKSQRRPTGYG